MLTRDNLDPVLINIWYATGLWKFLRTSFMFSGTDCFVIEWSVWCIRDLRNDEKAECLLDISVSSLGGGCTRGFIPPPLRASTTNQVQAVVSTRYVYLAFLLPRSVVIPRFRVKNFYTGFE